MGQHSKKGTKKDLALYRIEAAKSDVKFAEILLDAGELRGADTGPAMEFTMQFHPYMPWMGILIEVIEKPLQILINGI